MYVLQTFPNLNPPPSRVCAFAISHSLFLETIAEKLLGLGHGTTFLTNKDILELMHPLNPQVPYIYENFAQWGNTNTWDPCPECSPKGGDEGT